MEEKQENGGSNIILAMVSFFSSIVAIFIMYYIFAAIALATGFVSINKKESKTLAGISIGIVCVTFVIKIVNTLLLNGNLPQWLTNGMI